MDKHMYITTKLGTIIVTNTDDDEYPGVFVELRRENADCDMSIATIEVDNASKCLRTRVFGDGKTDDATCIVVHKNIEDWFNVE